MLAPTVDDRSPPPLSLPRIPRIMRLQGRLRRRSYWITQALVRSVMAVWAFIVPLTIGDPADHPVAVVAFIWLPTLVMAWISITLQVRRLHDLDLRGFWILLPLPCGLIGLLLGGGILLVALPLAATSLLALLMVLDGTPGGNRFGTDPKRRPDPSAAVPFVRTLARGFDRSALVGVTAALVVLVASPRLLGPASALMPRAIAARLGDAAVDRTVPPTWRCPAPATERALTRLAERMAPDMPVKIIYTTFPRINGLALPGGRIVVSELAVRAARQPEPFAAMLAHELAHARLRHPEGKVISSAALMLLPDDLVGRNGLINYVWAAPYSRAVERQADAEAARMMARAGLSPNHLGTMLERIRQQRSTPVRFRASRPNSWLASHPSTPDRIEHLARFPGPAVERSPFTPTEWMIVRAGCQAR